MHYLLVILKKNYIKWVSLFLPLHAKLLYPYFKQNKKQITPEKQQQQKTKLLLEQHLKNCQNTHSQLHDLPG